MLNLKTMRIFYSILIPLACDWLSLINSTLPIQEVNTTIDINTPFRRYTSRVAYHITRFSGS